MYRRRDIDAVIDALRRAYPDIAYEQLRVTHPGADDDGLWFFTHPRGVGEVQLESSSGQFAFLLEGDDSNHREKVGTIGEAVARVGARLGLIATTGQRDAAADSRSSDCDRSAGAFIRCVCS